MNNVQLNQTFIAIIFLLGRQVLAADFVEREDISQRFHHGNLSNSIVNSLTVPALQDEAIANQLITSFNEYNADTNVIPLVDSQLVSVFLSLF